MNKLTLVLLAVIFSLGLNLTYAQDKQDTSVIKKIVPAKSIDKKKIDITKPINDKKIDVTKQVKPKKYNYYDTTSKYEHKVKVKTVGSNESVTGLTPKVEVTKGTGKPVNSVCIVSGEELDSKITADYNGKTYGFCCKTCLKKFTKDPEKYISKFERSSKN